MAVKTLSRVEKMGIYSSTILRTLPVNTAFDSWNSWVGELGPAHEQALAVMG
jgi:hypothetical protein